MEPIQFLDIAKKLMKVPAEAAYRSAVSRAYYATFHAASAFLANLGFRASSGPQAHGEVQARLNNCGNEDGVQIARWLRELHGHRIEADYELTSAMFKAQFKPASWVLLAEQALQTLNTLSASPNLCDQIRKGIRVYEEKLKA